VDENRQEPTQKTRPLGIEKKTGKPYEPVDIPVPTRGAFDSFVRKVAGRPAGRKRPEEMSAAVRPTVLDRARKARLW